MAGTIRATSTSEPVECIRNRPTAHAAGTAISAESTVETTPTSAELPSERTISPSASTLRKFSSVGLKTRPTLGSVTWTFVLNAAAIIQTTGIAMIRQTTVMASARSAVQYERFMRRPPGSGVAAARRPRR